MPQCRVLYLSCEVHRKLKNKLIGSSFNCTVAGCGHTFKYLDAASHAQTTLSQMI